MQRCGRVEAISVGATSNVQRVPMNGYLIPMRFDPLLVGQIGCNSCRSKFINTAYTLLFTPSTATASLSAPSLGFITPESRLTSSTLLFPRLKHGVTHIPQEHRMPCHVYPPTFEKHLGHSNFPSNSPSSIVDCIQSCGSRKKWAHCAGRIESTCARGVDTICA